MNIAKVISHFYLKTNKHRIEKQFQESKEFITFLFIM